MMNGDAETYELYWYNSGYKTARTQTLKEMIDLIDQTLNKAAISGDYWTAQRALQSLKKDVFKLKGWNTE